MKKSLTDEEYLNLFKINENKYLIGIFQDGITVLKQQIRALNIFYALYNTRLKDISDPNYTIGIIGGGIAGLQISAALLKANFKVILFERQPIYLHMQFGCDVRKIHPNLYEWPDRNYNNPYAEMPVLDWKHGSASNIVKQIISEWGKVRDEVLKKNKKGFKWLTEISNCTISSIKRQLDAKDNYTYAVKYTSNSEFGNEDCDLLIYATGYGVERGVKEKAKTPSYWRNDELAQIDLDSPDKTYIISGVGDGGLIDLFRLKIFDFSYELILDIIENNTEFPDLLKRLVKIKEDIINGKLTKIDALYNSFKLINSDYYNYIFETLKSRDLIRTNTIWLNDVAADFEDTLDHKKLSFLHGFLIYLLEKNGPKIGISYKGGELKYDTVSRTYSINGEEVPKKSSIIIRHGTDRLNSIPSKYFSDSEKDLKLEDINIKQTEHYNYGRVVRRWSNSELSAIFNPFNERRFEYLNGNTTVLCTNLVSGLSNHLKNYFHKDEKFRISLHRLIYVKGEYFFQQITSYFGTHTLIGNDSVGQVFPINRGNIGLSYTTGNPVLVINRDDMQFKKLISDLDLTKELDKININKTFFTYPILSKINGGLATNLVLFFDSPNDLFGEKSSEKRKSILNIVQSSTTGFVEAINHHTNCGLIKMVETDFLPIKIKSEIPDWLKSNNCFQDVELDILKLPNNEANLLDAFHSFNII